MIIASYYHAFEVIRLSQGTRGVGREAWSAIARRLYETEAFGIEA